MVKKKKLEKNTFEKAALAARPVITSPITTLASSIIRLEQTGYDAFLHCQNEASELREYEQQNISQGNWKPLSETARHPTVELGQIRALHMSMESFIPLATAAWKMGVTFDRFAFTEGLAKFLELVHPSWSIDFSYIRANEAIFSQTWVQRATSFAGADLRRARFYETGEIKMRPGAIFAQTNFLYANLAEADMRCSHFSYCSFIGANLTNTDFRGCNVGALKASYFLDEAERNRASITARKNPYIH